MSEHRLTANRDNGHDGYGKETTRLFEAKNEYEEYSVLKRVNCFCFEYKLHSQER